MPKVLVVNDSLLEGRMSQDILTRQGYQVETARDGNEGLDMVRTFQPDVIISDVVLPRLSGLDMARRLKEGSESNEIPLIFASASDSKQDRIESFKAGGSDYITKPIDHEELILRIEIALRHKKAIDHLKRREGILRAGSSRDFLTGLYNRQFIDQKLAEELARVDRYGSTFSLVMMDLDHFKKINDTYGHPVGDKILIAVSGRMKSKVRPTDTVGRFGGEEFCVVAPETDLKGAFSLAEKLRKMVVGEAFPVSEELSIFVTASFGIAECRKQNETVQSLIERADKALYHAKNKGRNRVEWVYIAHPKPNLDFLKRMIPVKAEPFEHPSIPREVANHPLLSGIQDLTSSSDLDEYLAGWTRVYFLRNNSFVDSIDGITPQKMMELFRETTQSYMNKAISRFPQQNSEFSLREIIDETIYRGIAYFNQHGSGPTQMQ